MATGREDSGANKGSDEVSRAEAEAIAKSQDPLNYTYVPELAGAPIPLANIPGGTGEAAAGPGMEQVGYPPGSVNFQPTLEGVGMPDALGQGRCCENKICDCLGSSLKSIAASQQQIAYALSRKVEDNCSVIDKCFDKIVEKLRQKFEGPLRSALECKAMVAQGLGGTFEYAIRCAGKAIGDCDTICSAGDKSTEGKCCNTCGSPNCTCKDGTCVKVEVEKKKEGKYSGWCNRSTGSIIVVAPGGEGPGPGWEQVSLAETEQVAAEEAARACVRVEYFPTKEPLTMPPISGGVGSFCSIDAWKSGNYNAQIASNESALQYLNAAVQFFSKSGEIGVGGINVGNFSQIAVAIYNLFAAKPSFFAANSIPDYAKVIGCDNPAFIKAMQALTVVGLLNKETGADLSEFAVQYRYAANLACRMKFLGPDQAMAAYLSNAIGLSELDTIWGMHGACPENIPWMIQAQRPKPIQLQLSMLRRRELLSESGYRQGMRELGWLDPGQAESLHRLTEQIPTLSDIIRFMVRDAGDDKLASEIGLDSEFDTKYSAQLKKWSQWQGIPDDVAKYAWRSHWSIPSPSQLFTFLHRLRHDKQFGGEAKLMKDIKSALIQQDILPYWHEHYLKVSYLPMGRVDIRRAFNVGSLSDDELIPAYEQLGYDDETCKKLAKFTIRLRDIAAQSHRAIKLWLSLAINRAEAEKRMRDDGLPPAVVTAALDSSEIAFQNSPYGKAFVRGDIDRATLVARLASFGVSNAGADKVAEVLGLRITDAPALRDFAAGVMTKGDARAELTSDGMSPDIADRLLMEVDRAIDRKKALACQAAIKRRYLTGDLTRGGAINAMTNSGTTGSRAAYLADSWSCEQSSKDKAVAASKLCNWLARGAISATEFQRRLTNLGYSAADAALMLEDCLLHISVQRFKQAEKEAKEEAANSRRIQSAIEKANAAVQREQTRQANAAAAARKAKLARDKQLLSAIEKSTDKSQWSLFDATQYIRQAKQRIQDQYGLSVDEALQVLILAVEEWDGEESTMLGQIIDTMAETAANSGNQVSIN